MEYAQSTLTVLTLLTKYDEAHPEQDAATRAMRHLVFDQFVAVCGDVSLDHFAMAYAEQYRSALLGGWRPRTAEELSRMNCRLSGRARAGLMKGFGPVTAASYLKMIRPPFRWWTIHQRTNVDVWGQLPAIKRVRRSVKVYSDDRLARLMAEARRVQDGGLTEARVLVMATAGLRRAECQHLIESDIDWDRGTITVQPHDETDTTWLRDGIDLRSVQALMGHSEIATTEKYLTPDGGAVEKARTLGAARLVRLAGGSPPA